MEIFKNQAEVLMTLFVHEEPINANVIASLINTSLKTVKKEIDDLNYICRNYGCEIASYPGSGYTFRIEDKKAYEQFFDTVRGMFNKNLFYRNSQDERACCKQVFFMTKSERFSFFGCKSAFMMVH